MSDVYTGPNTAHKCPWCGKDLWDQARDFAQGHEDIDRPFAFHCEGCQKPIIGRACVSILLERSEP